MRRFTGSGLGRWRDQQCRARLRHARKVIKIVILAKAVNIVWPFAFHGRKKNNYAANFLSEGFTAGVINGVTLPGERKSRRPRNKNKAANKIRRKKRSQSLSHRAIHPRSRVLVDKLPYYFCPPVALCFACRKESMLLLSMRAEPVSTNEGIGAKLSFDQSVSSEDGL